MTEDEKYEIAVLTSAVEQKRRAWEGHAIMNTPTDPVEQEKAMIAYAIAQTEWLEAMAALSRAQLRIINKEQTMRQ